MFDMNKIIKVCHVTSAHSRYDTRIFQKECRSLSQHGYKCYLIVNDLLEDEIKEEIKILSTRISPKNRSERFFKTKKKMLELALKVDADVYHFHDPDLLNFALRLKRKKPLIKIIFDSHEDIPAQTLGKEYIPFILRKPLSFFLERYQRYMLPKYDAVITVTPHLVDKLKKINPETFMITNYPIIHNKEKANIKEKTSVEKRICFAGGISAQWNHETVINAIQDLDVEYLLCGSGSQEYINRLKKLNSWKKVKYLGKVPFKDVKKVYEKSFVGIALLSYSPNTNFKMGTLGNTKLFEYMEAGIPVICTDFTLWKGIIEENHCGICVNPYNIMEVKEAIKFFLEYPDRAKKMGENGEKAVREKYNWHNQQKKLIKLYDFTTNEA